MKTNEIQLRDPYVIPVGPDYYLFGTTDKNCWEGQGTGFDCYKSKDLLDWEGPTAAFRPPVGFWGTSNFWAPEVHPFNDRFYMFASFKGEAQCRGTQILLSDSVSGPYIPWSNGVVTPPDWECLDGTLHIDAEGYAWIVFCHEWIQVRNGAIYAMRLAGDLKQADEPPILLFNASEASWVTPIKQIIDGPSGNSKRCFSYCVTDGPFLHQLASGSLLMLWSSRGTKGYAIGIARSRTGSITGPWHQDTEPLLAQDGGHGMIFRALDGRLMLALHRPDTSPNERPVFIEIEETSDDIRIVDAPSSPANG